MYNVTYTVSYIHIRTVVVVIKTRGGYTSDSYILEKNV